MPLPFHFFGQIGGGLKQDHSNTEVKITQVTEKLLVDYDKQTREGSTHFDHKEKGAFGNISVGAAYEINKCLEWELGIGVNPIKAKTEHKCDLPIIGKGQSGYTDDAHKSAFNNNLPIHHVKESVYTLEKSASGHLSTALVIRNPIVSPFFGLSASVAQFKLKYSEEPYPGTENKIADQEEKKMRVGIGPMVGVRFKINPRLSLILFGNCQMYNKVELNCQKTEEKTGRVVPTGLVGTDPSSLPSGGGVGESQVYERATKSYVVKASPKYWFLGAALRVAFG